MHTSRCRFNASQAIRAVEEGGRDVFGEHLPCLLELVGHQPVTPVVDGFQLLLECISGSRSGTVVVCFFSCTTGCQALPKALEVECEKMPITAGAGLLAQRCIQCATSW